MDYSEIINELKLIKSTLSTIKPVQIESRVQWSGLIGIAQDMWKDRKLKKICKIPIVDNSDYLNLPFYLIDKAKELKQYLNSTENIEESAIAVSLILECIEIWKNICPEIGASSIDNEIGKGTALPMILVTKHYLYHTFIEYNLDEKLKKETESNIGYIDSQIERIINPKDNNSGCFSIILLISIPLSVLYLML